MYCRRLDSNNAYFSDFLEQFENMFYGYYTFFIYIWSTTIYLLAQNISR